MGGATTCPNLFDAHSTGPGSKTKELYSTRYPLHDTALVDALAFPAFCRLELGAISLDVPSLCPCEYNRTEHRIRFPDLRTKEKNVKRMREFQDVFLSYSEMDESNDNFDSSQ